jgi:hypothetical protein
MSIWKRIVDWGTEPRESKGFIVRWDCPFCPALFRSQEAADAHIANCKEK